MISCTDCFNGYGLIYFSGIPVKVSHSHHKTEINNADWLVNVWIGNNTDEMKR